MSDRNSLCESFLSQTPYANWQRGPLAGDASNRRYERLTSAEGQTVVLMDAPPEKGEDIRPFVRIADYLRAQGLSAPEILAQDPENGFLLLEDLGDDLYARIIEREPVLERELYEAATDALVALHQAPMPELESYGPRLMAEMAGLAFSKYRAGILGEGDADLQARFENQFEDILRETVKGDPVLVQRDYHAENLLWLPDRDGVARVGLLDFQDARAGHPAYDLVSLLQDARRDVPAGIEMQMVNRYIDGAGMDDSGFRTAYTVLGVQRNLRILGVFARLCHDYGKPHYVDLIPRVWDHLIRGLEHSALAPVANLLRDSLPAPTPENLEKLRP
ncbi:aminoglycoside phosphotransferase family protein [Leisingera sp. ANG-S5]|uniref:aminoglycoside phosphotransferase family protein n=1 Tax=Leisingera sp. ANG-S5 TaxID=1577901 RepID=UPI00057D1307|nr:phosphotransferase [Leisingera sp. ANG-S5]KIC32868.1 aminoglycoside phosphotransferase [Leisingera sp. ANG-S5]